MSSMILQIVQEYSTTAGAETVAFELSRALSRAGVPNEVRSSHIKATPTPPTVVRPLAGFLSGIATRGRMRYIGRLTVVPLFSLATWFAIKRQPGRIVISHGDCLNGDVMVVHAVNAASLAVKRAEGGWTWRLNPMHYWVGLRDRITIGGLRFRRYVAVSRRVADELVEFYAVPRDRIRIIPNGIDLARFTLRTDARNAVRTTYRIPTDAKVLMLAGHEFGRKGLEFVIRAMGHLDESYWLVVVGSDDPTPYRTMVPEVADRIIFAGFQRNMTDFYAAADVFVFPTSYETFSLVCMEALACGIPVIATPVGGIEDYIVDGVNGYFIDRTPSTIADRIRATFATPEHHAALKVAARSTAENYGWDSIAARYMDLFAELDRETAG